jgi:hypothetical protein
MRVMGTSWRTTSTMVLVVVMLLAVACVMTAMRAQDTAHHAIAHCIAAVLFATLPALTLLPAGRMELALAAPVLSATTSVLDPPPKRFA